MDPVTFSIIRHRLFRVVEEAVITLKHVSGSAITNEGHDLMVSLYQADGSLLMGGVGFLHHLTSAAEACKAIIRRFPGRIGEGELHVGDGGRQVRGGGHRVVRRVHASGHLRRRGEDVRGIRDEREAGDERGGHRADADVARDRRRRHGGDRALGEDGVASGHPEVHPVPRLGAGAVGRRRSVGDARVVGRAPTTPAGARVVGGRHVVSRAPAFTTIPVARGARARASSAKRDQQQGGARLEAGVLRRRRGGAISHKGPTFYG